MNKRIFGLPIAKAGLLLACLALASCGQDAKSPTAPPVTPPAPALRTVAFDANVTTDQGTAPASFTVVAGQPFEVPSADLAVAGFRFSGWNSRADGSGTPFAGGSTVSMPNGNLTLFAQWKAIPLKVTQVGTDSEVRLLIEWHDGSRQDVVYTPDLVGLGNSYDFNPIVGGIALLLRGGTRYIHTCYPIDYRTDRQAVMTVTSAGETVLRAASGRMVDRSGALSATSSTIEAEELRIVVSGRIVDADADTEVEIIVRADAPRMLLSRARLSYTKTTNVSRLYHQLVHANPQRLGDGTRFLYGSGSDIVSGLTLKTDISRGFFYLKEPNYYVGFLASRSGTKDFLAWQDGPYFAAYKIIYDDMVMNPGQSTESHGLSLWGSTTADASRLIGWADAIERGGRPVIDERSLRDAAVLRMLSQAMRKTT